jgi:adenine-specific DNA-methyltransferase
MRYFGSKGSVVEALYRLITPIVPSGSFCDPFGGIGIVGRHFKSKGYQVTTGDVLLFAHMFQVASIGRSRALRFNKTVAELGLRSTVEIESLLNSGRDRNGWFIEEYARKRKFFTTENAARIQWCWRHIIDWYRNGFTTHTEHAVLTASLIDNMDKVANTAGTYYAHLKTYSRKAMKPFAYRILPPTRGPVGHAVHSDALSLVRRGEFDILYLDPPYNERDYSAYYHLPETIANGQPAILTGCCGMPCTPRLKSRFTRHAEVEHAVSELLESACFRLLVFHYSDDGLIGSQDLLALLRPLGRVQKHSLHALGYRTTPGQRSTGHTLYLVWHA